MERSRPVIYPDWVGSRVSRASELASDARTRLSAHGTAERDDAGRGGRRGDDPGDHRGDCGAEGRQHARVREDKSVEHLVAVVSDAVSYYATMNAGRLPGADGTDDGLKADLKPHLRKFPVNPKQNSDSVCVVSAGLPLAPVGGATAGSTTTTAASSSPTDPDGETPNEKSQISNEFQGRNTKPRNAEAAGLVTWTCDF